MAEYLAQQSVNDYQLMQPKFLDEDVMGLFEDDQEDQNIKTWTLLFDRASNVIGHDIGAILISPKNQYIPMTTRLCFNCTNNIAEYEACAIGIKAVIESKAKCLNVYGDLTLVIHQIRGEWETRDHKLIPYRAYIMELVEYFDFIEFHHILREDNQLADALATLSSMLEINQDEVMLMIQMKSHEEPTYCHFIEEELDGKSWYFDIKHYQKTKECEHKQA